MAADLLHMGTIRHAHGVRGEVSLQWHAQFPFAPDLPFFLEQGGGGPRKITIRGARKKRDAILIDIDGVDDRDKAESLRGGRLLLPRACLPALAEDEVYAEDLPGMSVCFPDGSEIGVIDHVDYLSGKAVWSIISETGAEILFPAEPCFIASFDLAHKKVIVDPPAGLLEVYLA